MLAFLALALAAPQLPVIERQRPSPAVEVAADAAPGTVVVPKDAEPAEMPIDRAAQMGEWRLAMALGGRSCVLRLDNTAMGFGLFSLWQEANCPDGLFSATRWRLSDNRLELTDRSGRTLATLKMTEDGWQGQRSKDGAALRLERLN
jgi:hypothetical protein